VGVRFTDIALYHIASRKRFQFLAFMMRRLIFAHLIHPFKRSYLVVLAAFDDCCLHSLTHFGHVY
jgi:hypothetical protein